MPLIALLTEAGTPLPLLARIGANGAVEPVDDNILWDADAVGIPLADADLTAEERIYTQDNPYGRWVTIRGRRIFIRGGAALQARKLNALRTHKPSSVEKQRLGRANEEMLAEMLGGQTRANGDNDPLDLTVELGERRHGLEVKTFTDNTNDKVTMHPESLARKLKWGRKDRAALHTVVLDARRDYEKGRHAAAYSGHALWYRAGVGSFRLGNMVKVKDAVHLKALLRGEVGAYAFDPSQPRDDAGRWSDTGAGDEYPRAGVDVDGRRVREGPIPNTDSISASFNDYDVLPGVREVPLTAFDDAETLAGLVGRRLDARTAALAEAIRASGEITPLIVAVDGKGPYILEGGHRFDALIALGAKSFPALVVIDMDDGEVPRWRFTPDGSRTGAYAVGWDETKHPRQPEGSKQGGEFAPAGTGDKDLDRWARQTGTEGQLETIEAARRKKYEDEVRRIAEEEGVDPALAEVNWNESPEFDVAGTHYKMAGAAWPAGMIPGERERFVIYARNDPVFPSPGLVAHEVAHIKYQRVLNAYAEDTRRVWADPRKARTPGGREVDIVRPDGTLREAYHKDYPLYARMQPFMEARGAELQKDDGVTRYSRDWWTAWSKRETTTDRAMHETVAEIARLQRQSGKMLVKEASPLWNQYYATVEQTHRELQAKAEAK